MIPVQVAPVADHLINAFTLEASRAYKSFGLAAADTGQYPTMIAQRSTPLSGSRQLGTVPSKVDHWEVKDLFMYVGVGT